MDEQASDEKKKKNGREWQQMKERRNEIGMA